MADLPPLNQTALAIIAEQAGETVPYERVKSFIDGACVTKTMAAQVHACLHRVAVAIGALVGRAWGVNDFSYRLDRRSEGNIRKLSMWVRADTTRTMPIAMLHLELTPDGYVYRISELHIKHTSVHA